MEDRYISDRDPGICSQKDFEHDLRLWRLKASKIPKTECELQDLLLTANFLIKLACDKGYDYIE